MNNSFDNLSSEDLKILYNNYVTYRDKFCDGWAKISIYDFYNKYKLSEYTNSKVDN